VKALVQDCILQTKTASLKLWYACHSTFNEPRSRITTSPLALVSCYRVINPETLHTAHQTRICKQANMCIHKYYIFLNCGHSFFAPGPILICDKATFPSLPPLQHYRLSLRSSISTHAPYSSTCVPEVHPYRTVRIRCGLCLDCEIRRHYLLEQAEQNFIPAVRFDESKWRVQYQSMSDGKGKQKDEEWRKWGEEDMSVEQQMKLKQRETCGPEGFSLDKDSKSTKSLSGVIDGLRFNHKK
jgi:hypothetical protein